MFRKCLPLGMAGHSKWSKVKHIKGPLKVKRGAAFSKLVKEITVAARPGGGDLSGNLSPRPVFDMARVQNTPKENSIIRKGSGDLEGVNQPCAMAEGASFPRGQTASDDTQNVYSNFDIPKDILARLDA